MNLPRFIQIHTLHNYPGALLNRDDAGLAKRLPYGDAIRTRISSQCLKRHWRMADDHFALANLGVPMAVRSRQFVDRIRVSLEPDPVTWTPRSTKSVIHGRTVRSLATNRNRPAVGNAVPSFATTPVAFGLLPQHASAARILPGLHSPTQSDGARYCSNRCIRRSRCEPALGSGSACRAHTQPSRCR